MSGTDSVETTLLHYDAKISLRIRSQTVEPEAITAALNMLPDTVVTRGDTTRRLRSGRVVPRKAATEHFWVKTLAQATNPPDKLAVELERLLGRLEPRREFFNTIRVDGGEAEFFIGYFMRTSNTGDLLEPRLLGRLAALGIGLSFDIYEPGDLR